MSHRTLFTASVSEVLLHATVIRFTVLLWSITLFPSELQKGLDDAVQELISQRRGDKLPCAGRFKPASGYRGFGRSGQLVESSARRLRKVAKRHARFES